VGTATTTPVSCTADAAGSGAAANNMDNVVVVIPAGGHGPTGAGGYYNGLPLARPRGHRVGNNHNALAAIATRCLAASATAAVYTAIAAV